MTKSLITAIAAREKEQRALQGIVRKQPADLRFEKQRELWEDPSKSKVAFCGRRAGKTLGWCLDATDAMANNPRSLVLYIGLTKDAAKDIIWRAYEELNDEYGWGLKFRGELRAYHPNGSQFVIMGANTIRELEKARGPQKIAMAIVDECQSHKPFNLQYLVEEVLEPGMMDIGGTLCLSGTPGLVPSGFWYDVTMGQRRGWSVHSWTAADNPHVQFDEFIRALKERRGWDDQNPILRREYFREWIRDESKLVYPFDSSRNTVEILPNTDDGEWSIILSMDYGYVHSTAWCVLGYPRYDHKVYIFRSFKRAGQTPTDVADTTRKLIDEWNPDYIIGDLSGLGKAYSMQFEQKFGISIKPANKKDKRGTIEFVADALRTGTILSHERNETLHKEWGSLVWDELHEDIAEGQDDHEADAAMYGYKETPAYLNQLAPPRHETDGLPPHVKRDYEDHETWQERREKTRRLHQGSKEKWGEWE
jgi:hypothetical protein